MRSTAPRTCGDCTLCCKLLAIRSLDKPGGQWCSHCLPGKGCGIYDKRPIDCRSFVCHWLASDELPPEWRPDRSKIIFVTDGNRNQFVAYVDSGSPSAWRREPYISFLRAAAERGHATGGMVLVSVRNATTVVTPRSEHYLGVLGEDDRVMIREMLAPDGVAFEVSTVKAAEGPPVPLGRLVKRIP